MADNHNAGQQGDVFWRRAFFSNHEPTYRLPRKNKDLTVHEPTRVSEADEVWLTRLFRGGSSEASTTDRMLVLKGGAAVYEIPLERMGRETVIGRHPSTDLQLESYKLALYHTVVLKNEGRLYVESLDFDNGTLVNRKKLKTRTTVPLYDGDQIDIPGYRLQFTIANAPRPENDAEHHAEELEEIPDFFYRPPPPPPSPLLVNLVEDHKQLELWSEGVTRLRVADIIEETHDCKTFRLVGEEPILFSYKPGQFITFILNIQGREVKRSYSMSSSPSRPHILEITIKRVPGGLVSNWFCDEVKLGDILAVKGPSGKFTCFNFPSNKMLFIGAGSGITPIVSMSRWIADTAADVDVKLLASFKSPGDIIFRKEFELLSARSSGFQVAVTVTSGWHGTDSWTGMTGRISEEMINVLAPDLHDREVFMCGPEPFANGVEAILRKTGYDMTRFHTESFGSGRSAQGTAGGGKALELEGRLHKVTFTRSGKTVDTDEHVSLLELAESHGIEIDYSCRLGSCGECEVKCRGDVNASEDCEIDAKTREAGFIYACCSRALTDLELEA